jgi:hypothetical protein|tara:strand:+ start:62 stop:349 length:288 start_codon:yes stop_codon:yes gene_type:complete
MVADHAIWHVVEQGVLRFWPVALIAAAVGGALWRIGSAMWAARRQLEENSKVIKEFRDTLEEHIEDENDRHHDLAADVAKIKGLLNGGSRLRGFG